MVTYLDHTIIYADIIVTFCSLRLLFCNETIFLKSEELLEDEEAPNKIMNYKPSSRKTLTLLKRKQNKKKQNKKKQKTR